MSNEEFIQFIPIIKNVISKYKYCNIDYDDLFQIGSIAVLEGYKRFNDNKGMKLNTYLFSCITWAINKELEKNKRIDTFLNISLLETLKDDNVNIESYVTDKLIIEKYYKEISEKIKDPIKREVILLKVFENKTTKEISEILNIDSNKSYRCMLEARKQLLHRSTFVNNQYRRYKIECAKNKVKIYKNPFNFIEKLEEISKLKSHTLGIK